MNKRSKKLLSLFLSAAMVMSMSAFAFANEIESEIFEVGTATGEYSTIEESSSDSTITDKDGLLYEEKNGESSLKTTISYATDGGKKSTNKDLVTITNTTSPASWNNVYANHLLYTVLYGGEFTDQYLNHTKTVTVSHNDYQDIPGYFQDPGSIKYEVVTVEEGKAYLLVGYFTDEFSMWPVDGYENILTDSDDKMYAIGIPVTTWDGTIPDFNKSGWFLSKKGKSEKINIKLSLVTYENGTVKELAGVTTGGIKLDKKKVANASVSCDQTEEIILKDKDGNEKGSYYRSAAIGEIPSFTIKAKISGKEANAYKKAATAALKEKQFYFGIRQLGIYVSLDDDTINNIIENNKDSQEAIEKLIDEYFADTSINYSRDIIWLKIYSDKPGISVVVAGFNGKKANVSITLNPNDDNTTFTTKGSKPISIKLKEKTAYNLTKGSLASTEVTVLDFPANGNIVYKPSIIFSSLGYKYAFRVIPDVKKTFRYGIYKTTNQGFVYSE